MTTTDSANATSNTDWENIYAKCQVSEYKISLETFLESPREVLRDIGQGDAVESIAQGFEPLLPKQAEIARRVWEADKAMLDQDRRMIRQIAKEHLRVEEQFLAEVSDERYEEELDRYHQWVEEEKALMRKRKATIRRVF